MGHLAKAKPLSESGKRSKLVKLKRNKKYQDRIIELKNMYSVSGRKRSSRSSNKNRDMNHTERGNAITASRATTESTTTDRNSKIQSTRESAAFKSTGNGHAMEKKPKKKTVPRAIRDLEDFNGLGMKTSQPASRKRRSQSTAYLGHSHGFRPNPFNYSYLLSEANNSYRELHRRARVNVGDHDDGDSRRTRRKLWNWEPTTRAVRRASRREATIDNDSMLDIQQQRKDPVKSKCSTSACLDNKALAISPSSRTSPVEDDAKCDSSSSENTSEPKEMGRKLRRRRKFVWNWEPPETAAPKTRATAVADDSMLDTQHPHKVSVESKNAESTCLTTKGLAVSTSSRTVLIEEDRKEDKTCPGNTAGSKQMGNNNSRPALPLILEPAVTSPTPTEKKSDSGPINISGPSKNYNNKVGVTRTKKSLPMSSEERGARVGLKKLSKSTCETNELENVMKLCIDRNIAERATVGITACITPNVEKQCIDVGVLYPNKLKQGAEKNDVFYSSEVKLGIEKNEYFDFPYVSIPSLEEQKFDIEWENDYGEHFYFCMGIEMHPAPKSTQLEPSQDGYHPTCANYRHHSQQQQYQYGIPSENETALERLLSKLLIDLHLDKNSVFPYINKSNSLDMLTPSNIGSDLRICGTNEIEQGKKTQTASTSRIKHDESRRAIICPPDVPKSQMILGGPLNADPVSSICQLIYRFSGSYTSPTGCTLPSTPQKRKDKNDFFSFSSRRELKLEKLGESIMGAIP